MIKHIEIGGEKRAVRYNANALEEYEELTGVSIFEEGTIRVKNFKQLKALAFCGLKHGFLEENGYLVRYPESLQTIGRMLDMSRAGDFIKALNRDMPEETEGSQEVEAGKKLNGVTSEV